MLMQGQNAQTGTCDDDNIICYVNIKGEIHFLIKDDPESVFRHPTDPCLQYSCKVSEPIIRSSISVC